MAIHIYLINDIREHKESIDCECRPKVIFENGEMIIIHNRFDLIDIGATLIDDRIIYLN